MSKWKKYRKRPVVIDAVRFYESMDPWPRCVVGAPGVFAYIETPEGRMYVKDGDWIIRGVLGEYYPCKDEVFRKTYEAVEGGET